MPGLERLNEKPSDELVSIYLDCLQPTSQIVKEYYKYVHKRVVSETLVKEISNIKKLYDFKTIIRILCCFCHRGEYLISHPEIYDYVEEFLNETIDSGTSYQVKEYKNYLVLDMSLENGGF